MFIEGKFAIIEMANENINPIIKMVVINDAADFGSSTMKEKLKLIDVHEKIKHDSRRKVSNVASCSAPAANIASESPTVINTFELRSKIKLAAQYSHGNTPMST